MCIFLLLTIFSGKISTFLLYFLLHYNLLYITLYYFTNVRCTKLSQCTFLFFQGENQSTEVENKSDITENNEHENSIEVKCTNKKEEDSFENKSSDCKNEELANVKGPNEPDEKNDKDENEEHTNSIEEKCKTIISEDILENKSNDSKNEDALIVEERFDEKTDNSNKGKIKIVEQELQSNKSELIKDLENDSSTENEQQKEILNDTSEKSMSDIKEHEITITETKTITVESTDLKPINSILNEDIIKSDKEQESCIIENNDKAIHPEIDIKSDKAQETNIIENNDNVIYPEIDINFNETNKLENSIEGEVINNTDTLLAMVQKLQKEVEKMTFDFDEAEETKDNSTNSKLEKYDNR